MKGGKPGLNVRRKGALARLEVTYEAFKKAGEDKRNLITRNITVKEITHFPKKEEETSAEVETQVTE